MDEELTIEKRVAQAEADARSHAIEIIQLCHIYGYPELASWTAYG